MSSFFTFRQRIAGSPLLLFISLLPSVLLAEEAEWLTPKPLRPGDTIMLVAPAGVVDRTLVEAAVRRFEEMGFRVIASERIYQRQGYLAGADDARAEELNRAFRDPRVRAVFPCRGGYGVTRILDRIDFEALRKDPKIVIGFSDITALHLAIARRAKVITFHSPMPQAYLGSDAQEHRFSCARFWRLVSGLDAAGDAAGGGITPLVLSDFPGHQTRLECLVPGTARGRLVGGNLSLICATLGTPYAIDAKDKLLFLEDVSERPYRIDRMLCQLRLAGVFDAAAGVILGDFTDTDEVVAGQVLDHYFADLKIPVIKGFPIGHGPLNLTLPHGAMAEMDATRRAVHLLAE